LLNATAIGEPCACPVARARLFPAPKQIAPQIVGWLKADIDIWLGNLPSKGSSTINVAEK